MSYGYNVVTVRVVPSAPVTGLNISLFAGTIPTNILAQQLNTTTDNYSLFRAQVFNNQLNVLPTIPGLAVRETSLQIGSTNTSNPISLPLASPPINFSKGFERIALVDPVSSIPVSFFANNYIAYSFNTRFTPAITSAANDRSLSYPFQTPTLTTVAARTGTWTTISNSVYNITQGVTVNPVANALPIFSVRNSFDVTVTGNLFGVTGLVARAPSTTPFAPIIVGTDVAIITANTATQANYAFVPRYTTSTVVNVAPSSYDTLSTTNQRNLDYWVLKLMYDPPSANITMPSPATLAFPTPSYTTGGNVGIITIYRERSENIAAPIRRLMYDTVINGAPYYTTGGNIGNVVYSQTSARPLGSYFLFSTPFNGTQINYIAQSEITTVMPRTRADQNLIVQSTADAANDRYSTSITSRYNIFNSALERVFEDDIAVLTAYTANGGSYNLRTSSRQVMASNLLPKVNASVNGELPALTVLNRSNIVLRTSSVNTSIRQAGPNRTNYISVNNAGINIISVTMYEPIYGGLTPPISSSGEFGGVQTGVLGYQFWT